MQLGLREIYRWVRSNLVLILVLSLLTLQFLTWRAIVDLKRYLPGDPPDCNSSSPCTVELTEYTIKQLAARMAR
jgi:hypothetical protein